MATSSNDKKNNTSYPPPQNPPPGGYSGGAFYPYSSPPPPPSSYPTAFYQAPATTFTYQEPPPAVVRSFLCGFPSVITAIAVLFGLISLIAYFVLKPRIPEFSVNSASLTSLSLNGSSLNAKWDVTLIVSNPNKKLDITYDSVLASVFYGHDEYQYGVLAPTRLAPFHQPTHSTTMLRVQFAVLDYFVDNRVTIGITDGRVRGLVQFGVVVKTLIKLNGLFHPSDHLLKVTCKPLNFGIPSSNITNINNVAWELLGSVACE